MTTRNPSVADAAEALNHAAIHLLRGVRAVDARSGLTAARLSALSVVVFGGPTPLGALARAEDVAAPTMSRIVDGLCELGLAARSTHPDSARVVLVSATAEGERVMEVARQRRIDTIRRGLMSLSPQDRQAIVAAGPALRELATVVPRQARREGTAAAARRR